jgi:hypothetical protein
MRQKRKKKRDLIIMLQIILTSFFNAKSWDGTKISIARYQPDWSTMPEFPVNIKPILGGKTLGDWLSPNVFRFKYEEVLKIEENNLLNLFDNIEDDKPLILCCWCNPNQARQKQFNGKLFCHRILLGYWIEEHYNSAIVKYEDGAENPIWKRD